MSPKQIAQRTAAGAAGGKASGKSKARDMKRVKVGRGSAGRVGQRSGVKSFRNPMEAAMIDDSGRYFPDVIDACDRWLAEHGQPRDLTFRQLIDAELAEARARKSLSID